MKKIIILLAVVCFSIPFYGQEKALSEAKLKTVFGVKAGVNLINTKTDDGNSNIGIGYQVGATLNIPISSKFSFQPELMLQVVNSKYEYYNVYSNGNVREEVKNKNTFLQLPLNFNYAISRKVAIELGPNIGYIVGYKQTVERTTNLDGIIMVSERNSTEIDGNKIIFGANLGANYNITDAIYTGLRYTLFISEYQTADSTLSNSLFSLSLGYNFK
jgi:Outer membrane protein beta-barrel domain